MACRVLVADDEELERRALGLILSQAGPSGIEILEAANGAEAVEAASGAPIDAAFLDIRMPGVDGIEAARLLRERMPELPIIFLTAHDSFDYARSALRLRVEDFLLKPASSEEVVAALGRALGRSPGREGDRRLETAVSYMAEEIRSELAFRRFDEASFARYAALRDCGSLVAVFALAAGAAAGERSRSALPSLASLAERLFSADSRAAIAGVADDCVLCALASLPQPESSEPWLKEALESLIERARSELGLVVSVGAVASAPDTGCGGAGTSSPGPGCAAAALRALALASRSRPLVLVYVGPSAPPEDPGLAAGSAAAGVVATGAVARAISIMESRYAEDLSLDGVASELGLSPSHLSRLIGRQAGLGFADCLARLRVERAKAFLGSGRISVKEAAAMVGFRDPAYFAKVFRRFCGMSPAEFRALGAERGEAQP